MIGGWNTKEHPGNMIRRILCFVVALVSCIAVSACTGQTTNGSEAGNGTVPSVTGEEPGNTEPAKERSNRAFYSMLTEMYTEEFVFYDMDQYLRYFDVASRSSVLYCFDPGCEHLRSRLNARTGEVEVLCPAYRLSDRGLCLRQDGIYYTVTSVIPELMKADREAKNRRLVARAEIPLGTPVVPLFTEEDLFFVYMNMNKYTRQETRDGGTEWLISGTREEREAGVYRMSLDGTSQCQVFRSEGNYDNTIMELYEYDGHVFFCHEYIDIPFSELPSGTSLEYPAAHREHNHIRVYDYDVQSDRLTCVLAKDRTDTRVSFFDGYFLCRTGTGDPAALYRMNGELLRELPETILNGVCGDGCVILHVKEDGKRRYRMYDPERDAILKEVVVPDRITLEYAIGESYYVYVPSKKSGTEKAYIPAEDFWNGKFEEAVALLPDDAG